MEPYVQPGALGRPAVEVGAAHAVALAMFRHEADTSPAKPWLGGMVQAARWIIGYAPRSPLTDVDGPATRDALEREFLAAGQADMPGTGDPREPARMYARGAYRMLAYALGLRDELPVQLSTAVAQKMLTQQERHQAA